MRHLKGNNMRFKNHPEVLYATDVTFQQVKRPSGNITEGKLYFTGKYKIYGYKVEVSVYPNDMDRM